MGDLIKFNNINRAMGNGAVLISKHQKEFEQVLKESPLAENVLKAGGTVEDVVIVLHGFIKDILLENQRLEQICPRKWKNDVTGEVKVWHCPDEMIPMSVFKDEEESK